MQRLCKCLFQRDIQISCKPYTGNCVDHANALTRFKVQRILHVFDQVDERQRACDIIGNLEERFLVHFPCVRMVSPEELHLFPDLL